MRLIDADELIERIAATKARIAEIAKESLVDQSRTEELVRFGMGLLCSFAADVNDMPTVKECEHAEKVGTWLDEYDDGDTAECSVCGECFDTAEAGFKLFTEFYKFCPCCGARMVNEDE